jgi:hypothetical protein
MINHIRELEEKEDGGPNSGWNDRNSISWSGGQDVVTAAKLLAEASMKEGKYFQALPDYGGKRMGAPIRAYARL